MQNVDPTLLNRLGAYVDGELSDEDAKAVERLIADDPDIGQIVDRLRSSSDRIRDDFLQGVATQPTPEAWVKLIQEQATPETKSPSPPWMRYLSPTWSVTAAAALCCLLLALLTATYLKSAEVRDLRERLALGDGERESTTGKPAVSAVGQLAPKTAEAGYRGPGGAAEQLSMSTERLQDRLALVIGELKDATDKTAAWQESVNVAIDQIESLREELKEVMDPVHLMTSEHRGLIARADYSDGLLTTEVADLERILGSTWQRDATIPDLSSEGLSFVGGRLVAVNDLLAAHLIYRQDDEGELLGVWILRESQAEIGMGNAQENGLNLTSWSKSSLVFLAMGRQSLSFLTGIKNNISSP